MIPLQLNSRPEVKIVPANDQDGDVNDKFLDTVADVAGQTLEVRIDTIKALEGADLEAQRLKTTDKRLTISGAVFAILGGVFGLFGGIRAIVSRFPSWECVVLAALCAFIAVILKASAKLYLSKKEKRLIKNLKIQLE